MQRFSHELTQDLAAEVVGDFLRRQFAVTVRVELCEDSVRPLARHRRRHRLAEQLYAVCMYIRMCVCVCVCVCVCEYACVCVCEGKDSKTREGRQRVREVRGKESY